MTARRRRALRWLSFSAAWVLLGVVAVSAVTILKREQDRTLLAVKQAKRAALEYVAPQVAIAGLPVYLTGRHVLPVSAVRFVRQPVHDRRTYVQTAGINHEKSSVQFNLALGALPPGRYRVSVVGTHQTSTARTIVVEAASSVRLGSTCYEEWGQYSITGAGGVGLTCGDPVGGKWRWERFVPTRFQAKPPTIAVPAVAVSTGAKKPATKTPATKTTSSRTSAASSSTTTSSSPR